LTYSGSKQSRLTNPQAGLGFDLEGADSHELVMPPPPRFDSKEIIAEMAESYWMALTRDVAFLDYIGDPMAGKPGDAMVRKAYEDLSKYEQFKGPKNGGNVTVDTVFRGSTDGDLIGPYVSQFLVRDIPFGAYELQQRVVYAFAPDEKKRERVFLITAKD